MAIFTILQSRRLGLGRCEFDASSIEGEIQAHEIFQIVERGTLWEYVILAVRCNGDAVTLDCLTWIPEDGAFVGERVTSRQMKAVEKKRYAKAMPAA